MNNPHKRDDYFDSWAVIGREKDGVEVLLRRFPGDRYEAAAQWALAQDLEKFEDIFVRGSNVRPDMGQDFSGALPLKIMHYDKVSRVRDANGRKVGTLYGDRDTRNTLAEAFVSAGIGSVA